MKVFIMMTSTGQRTRPRLGKVQWGATATPVLCEKQGPVPRANGDEVMWVQTSVSLVKEGS